MQKKINQGKKEICSHQENLEVFYEEVRQIFGAQNYSVEQVQFTYKLMMLDPKFRESTEFLFGSGLPMITASDIGKKEQEEVVLEVNVEMREQQINPNSYQTTSRKSTIEVTSDNEEDDETEVQLSSLEGRAFEYALTDEDRDWIQRSYDDSKIADNHVDQTTSSAGRLQPGLVSSLKFATSLVMASWRHASGAFSLAQSLISAPAPAASVVESKPLAEILDGAANDGVHEANDFSDARFDLNSQLVFGRVLLHWGQQAYAWFTTKKAPTAVQTLTGEDCKRTLMELKSQVYVLKSDLRMMSDDLELDDHLHLTGALQECLFDINKCLRKSSITQEYLNDLKADVQDLCIVISKWRLENTTASAPIPAVNPTSTSLYRCEQYVASNLLLAGEALPHVDNALHKNCMLK